MGGGGTEGWSALTQSKFSEGIAALARSGRGVAHLALIGERLATSPATGDERFQISYMFHLEPETYSAYSIF